MKTIPLNTLNDLEPAAKQFIELMGNHKIFAFYGEMGAGKTTFIKTICRLLGVKDNITSPTFAIVNEYISKNNSSIFHFDCYRLKNTEEAFNIGAEEYFYSGSLCFIEWPEKIEELLPDTAVRVKISVEANQRRSIEIDL